MNNLTIRKFQNRNRKRGAHTEFFSWSLAEQTNALCGEAGEAANVAKKILRDGWTQELADKLALELADTITYADLILSSLRKDTQDALVEKFNIVSDRFGVDIKL